ncbi:MULTISPECIES: hypothetical protein [unclassified Streptomyces]|uniref:hypothetical protein n=1 Tax=unclassified Streptomyces TaxID=2593676 RepID=UPI002E2D6B00|nr:hypothetical protein [Streptomyces sp. NBC_00334]
MAEIAADSARKDRLMDRMHVFVALVAVVALALTAWTKPLKVLSFWPLVIVCMISYPVGARLFSAFEEGRSGGAWVEWTFLLSVALLITVLVASALRFLTSSRGPHTDRHAYHQDPDA